LCVFFSRSFCPFSLFKDTLFFFSCVHPSFPPPCSTLTPSHKGLLTGGHLPFSRISPSFFIGALNPSPPCQPPVFPTPYGGPPPTVSFFFPGDTFPVPRYPPPPPPPRACTPPPFLPELSPPSFFFPSTTRHFFFNPCPPLFFRFPELYPYHRTNWSRSGMGTPFFWSTFFFSVVFSPVFFSFFRNMVFQITLFSSLFFFFDPRPISAPSTPRETPFFPLRSCSFKFFHLFRVIGVPRLC